MELSWQLPSPQLLVTCPKLMQSYMYDIIFKQNRIFPCNGVQQGVNNSPSIFFQYVKNTDKLKLIKHTGVLWKYLPDIQLVIKATSSHHTTILDRIYLSKVFCLCTLSRHSHTGFLKQNITVTLFFLLLNTSFFLVLITWKHDRANCVPVMFAMAC